LISTKTSNGLYLVTFISW